MCCTLEYTKYVIIVQVFWLSHWQVYSVKLTTTASHYPLHGGFRRQKGPQLADEDMKNFKPVTGEVGPQADAKQVAAGRFSTWATKTKRKPTRTTPEGTTLEENCDYIAISCLHVYTTGKLCARTLYYSYRTFQNYCMLDYVNCREGEEMWQVVHMGGCFQLPAITEYMHYVYNDDWFLDNYYILDDH